MLRVPTEVILNMDDLNTFDSPLITNPEFDSDNGHCYKDMESAESIAKEVESNSPDETMDDVKDEILSHFVPFAFSLDHIIEQRYSDLSDSFTEEFSMVSDMEDELPFILAMDPLKPRIRSVCMDFESSDNCIANPGKFSDNLNKDIVDISSTSRTIVEEDKTVVEEKKGCTCSKTSCLKLYCECLAGNKRCGPYCRCLDCKNWEGNQEEIEVALSQITAKSDCSYYKRQANSKGIVSCNCDKTGCQKKYCFCYRDGVACGSLCKCKDCRNKKKVLTNNHGKGPFLITKTEID